jgi:hypothetical protein
MERLCQSLARSDHDRQLWQGPRKTGETGAWLVFMLEGSRDASGRIDRTYETLLGSQSLFTARSIPHRRDSIFGFDLSRVEKK